MNADLPFDLFQNPSRGIKPAVFPIELTSFLAKILEATS